jgi:hypothetical protein
MRMNATRYPGEAVQGCRVVGGEQLGHAGAPEYFSGASMANIGFRINPFRDRQNSTERAGFVGPIRGDVG